MRLRLGIRGEVSTTKAVPPPFSNFRVSRISRAPLLRLLVSIGAADLHIDSGKERFASVLLLIAPWTSPLVTPGRSRAPKLGEGHDIPSDSDLEQNGPFGLGHPDGDVASL